MNKNIEDRIKLIGEIPLLGVLPDSLIREYLRIGIFKVVSYPKDSVIHFDGDLCSKLEIILSGKVAIDRIDEAGNLMTISEFSSDNILGGNLLYSKTPYFPMTVIAQSQTSVLEMDKETLFKLLCKYPEFLRMYLEYTAENTFTLGYKIKHTIKKTIREALLNYLEHESKKQNSKKIELGMSKKVLAERIGVQRTSLSRELAKMRDEGLISFDADSITLLKSQ
jgi:CRP-like cAMP-binding protein